MKKITDKNYQNLLYNTLRDGGFEAEEAKKLIGQKYEEELYRIASEEISSVLGSIEKKDIKTCNQIIDNDNEGIGNLIEILKKIQEIETNINIPSVNTSETPKYKKEE